MFYFRFKQLIYKLKNIFLQFIENQMIKITLQYLKFKKSV